MAADPSPDDDASLQRRIAELERENATLRSGLTDAGRAAQRAAAATAARNQQHAADLAASHARTEAATAETREVRKAAAKSEWSHAQERMAARAELASAEGIIAALEAVQSTARESETRLRALLQSATDYAIVATDLEGKITLWNSGARALLGWEDTEVLGRSVALIFTPEDREAGAPEAEMAEALAEGRAEHERWQMRKDGTRFLGTKLVMVLRNGQPNGFLKILRDRSEQRRIEQAWQSGEERLRLIVDSAIDYAIFTIDRTGFVTSWNTGAQRLLGYAENEIVGRDGRIIFTPEDREAGAPEWEIGKAVAAGRAENERWHVRKDGSRFWGSGLMMPLKASGELGLLKIMRDDTERRRADDAKQLLIGELNHRVKNTLATVQSLAEQTLKGADTLEAFASAFTSRLLALARAHDLVTREAWEGAEIADIAGAAMQTWFESGRVRTSGPRVRVSPKQALALSMALNELATNAAKYGALSVPEGEVALAWTNGSECELQWAESGGPPVAPPSRQGFGLRVLNRALAVELDGPVELRFEPTGVMCRIRFAVETGAAASPQPPARDA
jgi:PAS domain S-box-containing protein